MKRLMVSVACPRPLGVCAPAAFDGIALPPPEQAASATSASAASVRVQEDFMLVVLPRLNGKAGCRDGDRDGDVTRPVAHVDGARAGGFRRDAEDAVG